MTTACQPNKSAYLCHDAFPAVSQGDLANQSVTARISRTCRGNCPNKWPDLFSIPSPNQKLWIWKDRKDNSPESAILEMHVLKSVKKNRYNIRTFKGRKRKFKEKYYKMYNREDFYSIYQKIE